MTLATEAVDVKDGLSTWLPSDGLKPVLDRGETPATPSFKQWRRGVQIVAAEAGSGNDPKLSYDTYENTSWESSNRQAEAWVTYTLAEDTQVDDICVKMKGFRATTYPIGVYAGDSLVWKRLDSQVAQLRPHTAQERSQDKQVYHPLARRKHHQGCASGPCRNLTAATTTRP